MLVPDNGVCEMSASFVILNKQGALKLVVYSQHPGTLPFAYFFQFYFKYTFVLYLIFFHVIFCKMPLMEIG